MVQQAVGPLPWGHNLVLLTKLKTSEDPLLYAEQALARGWSRNVLALHIEQRTLGREGRALTNFERWRGSAANRISRVPWVSSSGSP